jgi:HK97 family phage major capsid protein
MTRLKEIKEQRAAVHAQLTEELKKNQSAETRSTVDKMLNDIETLSADIVRIERADKVAAEIAAAPANNSTEQRSSQEVAAEREQKAKAYRSAFKDYLTYGAPGNKWQRGSREESYKVLHETRRAMERAETPEQRDQLAGTQSITWTQGNVGGFFVPAGFVYDVEKATKFFAPLLDGSTIRVLETASGQILPYPTSNDTKQAWTLVGEATQVTDQGTGTNYPTQGTAPSGQPGNQLLGHVDFKAYKGTTGLVRVSIELLQDSAFDIEAFLQDAFAQRLGRGYEYYLTNGSGSNAPTGILPAIAASGATPVVAAGSAVNDGSSNTGVNSIGYADLVNLVHSVDPSYRRNAKFMFHDNTLRFLKTLLDKFGRPLWVPGVKEGEPDTICGYQYVINQSFPTIAASAVTVAFGAWSKFIARKVKDLQVLRLDERFADFGEIAFVGFSRIDSNLVDAGTHPLNVLQQHS